MDIQEALTLCGAAEFQAAKAIRAWASGKPHFHFAKIALRNAEAAATAYEVIDTDEEMDIATTVQEIRAAMHFIERIDREGKRLESFGGVLVNRETPAGSPGLGKRR